MPHGESWFSFLPFYDALEHWVSDVFPPSYLEHNPRFAVRFARQLLSGRP